MSDRGDLVDFATTVNRLAREAGARKVLIGQIWDAMGYPNRRDFEKSLLRAHRDGLVDLQRADVTRDLDPDDLEASHVRDPIGAEYHYILAPARNPADRGRDEQEARDMFRRFHQLEENRVYVRDITMPGFALPVGRARHVLYRSSKIDPETDRPPRGGAQNYIHEHDAGVMLYEPCGPNAGGVAMPKEFAECEGLARLGFCLGIAFTGPEGHEYEMEGSKPLPELYCVPSGKALVIVQSKREILYIAWGGALGVEPRGIVG
jgi:hypothetical protein